MKTTRWSLAVLGLLSSLAAGCGSASQGEAQEAANQWAAAHAMGWNVTFKETNATNALAISSPGQGCINDFLDLRYANATGAVYLDFACPDTQTKDLAWLQSSFRQARVEIPPTNLGAEGWTFQILTPSSWFDKTVTFDAWEADRVSLRIETATFEIRGDLQDSRCQVVDGPSPRDCFVALPYVGPLRITMDVPLSPDTLVANAPLRP